MPTIVELRHPQGALVAAINNQNAACGSGGAQGVIWQWPANPAGPIDPLVTFDNLLLWDLSDQAPAVAVGVSNSVGGPGLSRAIRVLAQPGAAPQEVLQPGYGAEATCITDGGATILGDVFFWHGPEDVPTGFIVEAGNPYSQQTLQSLLSSTPIQEFSLAVRDVNGNGDFCAVGGDGRGFIFHYFPNAKPVPNVGAVPLASVSDLGTINLARQVAGTSRNYQVEDFAPALWTGPGPVTSGVIAPVVNPTLLPLPPGFVGGRATAISPAGNIVGTCWPENPDADRTTFSPDQRAFYYTPPIFGQSTGVSVPLENAFPGLDATGWTLQWGMGISNEFSIVGWGLYQGRQTSFLITP